MPTTERKKSRNLQGYKLPPLLVAALVTNRGELARSWASRQADKEKREMGLLLADLLEDRWRWRERLADIEQWVETAISQSQAAHRAVIEAIQATKGAEVRTEYVVHRKKRDSDDEEQLFWSNTEGWVDIESADVFSAEEMRRFKLPLEGEWLPLPASS